MGHVTVMKLISVYLLKYIKLVNKYAYLKLDDLKTLKSRKIS